MKDILCDGSYVNPFPQLPRLNPHQYVKLIPNHRQTDDRHAMVDGLKDTIQPGMGDQCPSFGMSCSGVKKRESN